MSQKKIFEFTLGDNITGFYSVRKKTIREYAKGQFVSLELGDNSGRINGVMWEPDQFALNEMQEGMIIKIQASVGEYNGRNQLTLHRLRLAQDNEYSLEDILPFSKQTEAERKTRIMALTDRITNANIKKLVLSFWEDEKFLKDFLMAAAGKLWHHACIGGLSEHSCNVAELALRASEGYDFLNKDYLIFGGLFHDAGKIATYTTAPVIDYTDEGRLIGHICLVDDWICRRAAQIENFPDKLLIALRHIILSHQGELQYATPVVPQMPEAFLVYYCDEIDSKMGAIERIRERHGGQGWSDYVNLISRYLYFGEKPEQSENL